MHYPASISFTRNSCHIGNNHTDSEVNTIIHLGNSQARWGFAIADLQKLIALSWNKHIPNFWERSWMPQLYSWRLDFWIWQPKQVLRSQATSFFQTEVSLQNVLLASYWNPFSPNRLVENLQTSHCWQSGPPQTESAARPMLKRSKCLIGFSSMHLKIWLTF